MLLAARQGRTYVSLDPGPTGGYRVLTATALAPAAGREARVLVASYEVPEQLGGLADGVQSAYSQYGQRMYQRPFAEVDLHADADDRAAAVGARRGVRRVLLGERLVKPVQDLIAGTRAVGKGDFEHAGSPLPSRDEMGFLVHSFNDMTKRLSRARARRRAEPRRGRAGARQPRGDPRAALDRRDLAGVGPAAAHRQPGRQPTSSAPTSRPASASRFAAVAAGQPLVEQFLAACRRHLDVGQTEWREQLQLKSDTGRRVLMCACTTLPAEDGASSGLVIVFDDITTLLQAQRDAAWGEVARRLAHEIKNPLTPIQLSAERMRRKLCSAR